MLHMKKYDFLIVGAGLYGSVFAHQAGLKGKKCLVIDKRSHIGGNVFCESTAGINVHKYGAHIFHTSNKIIWNYVSSFVEFNQYINSPLANYKGRLYNLPFNMNTFYQLWGVTRPDEARKKVQEKTKIFATINPENLEEQALKLVGKEIYTKFIKGYSEKQWGRIATEIPAFIIKRIPLRFTFNNNYYDDVYQGIPIGGYNVLINKLLEKADLQLNTCFSRERDKYEKIAEKILYTGKIDEFFLYCFGKLAYRSLRFENELLNIADFQGNAVVNYTDAEIPFTRIIEHKHFEFGTQDKTYITREYPQDWDETKEPYYPINDEINNAIFNKYKEKSALLSNVYFGGRLADYAYYDMDKTITNALELAKRCFNEKKKKINPTI
jgi:UDP-galactopyranose mutase